MPLAFYICAGITALFLIFALSKIVSRLYDIHICLLEISNYLADILKFSIRESKHCKKREYWRDQNGFRHWRKTNNA